MTAKPPCVEDRTFHDNCSSCWGSEGEWQVMHEDNTEKVVADNGAATATASGGWIVRQPMTTKTFSKILMQLRVKVR